MKYPKLKNALLCRILTYVVVVGGFMSPCVILLNIKPIPDAVKILVLIACPTAMLIYILKNIAILMSMDFVLARMHCNNTARKQFTLPPKFSVPEIEKKLSSFGTGYEPQVTQPFPSLLRYQCNMSFTTYARAIEKVITTYHTEYLDKNEYRTILNSAIINSRALREALIPRFRFKEQKNSNLDRVTIIFIFATKLDDKFHKNLFKTVYKDAGSDLDNSVLPCIIDLEKRICVFNSLRFPYNGFKYAIKNRGIRLIKKYVFGGRLPFDDNPHTIIPFKDIDYEQSLWAFWREYKKEIDDERKKKKKRSTAKECAQLNFKDDFLYIKWSGRGILLTVDLDEEQKTAKISSIRFWTDPTNRPIAKKNIASLEELAANYFTERGYTPEFMSDDD